MPSHVGLLGNEAADKHAKETLSNSTTEQQEAQPIEFVMLKICLKHKLLDQWKEKVKEQVEERHRHVLGCPSPNLKNMQDLPREVQTLFVRCRAHEVETAGTCSRRLEWESEDDCRMCHQEIETVLHILARCPDALPHLQTKGWSCKMSEDMTVDNVQTALQLDLWLKDHAPAETNQPGCGMTKDTKAKPTHKKGPVSKKVIGFAKKARSACAKRKENQRNQDAKSIAKNIH